MLHSYPGEIAALLASVCFSIGPALFTLAGRRISVGTVNRSRLLVTMILLIVPHWYFAGTLLPLDAQPERWLWLGFSGLLSLVIGDSLLFAAFALIGTRLTMLVASLMPVSSALLAWIFLGETLSWTQITGILVTIGGVSWVVSDRNNGSPDLQDRATDRKGLLLALGGAIIHSCGAIAAKKGLGGDFPALSGHVIRIFVSMLIVVALMFFQGKAGKMVSELRTQASSIKYVLVGAIFGPLTGMWLSLFAIQNTSVGIATSLTSLPPVWLLPIGFYLFKERIGVRAVLGSLVAVIGVAILFLL